MSKSFPREGTKAPFTIPPQPNSVDHLQPPLIISPKTKYQQPHPRMHIGTQAVMGHVQAGRYSR